MSFPSCKKLATPVQPGQVKANPTARPLPPPLFMRKRVVIATCNYFECLVRDLTGTDQHQRVVLPRQMAMMIVRERTKRTFPQIGSFFNRDHTTCIHAYYAMREKIEADADLRQHYDNINAIIDGLIHPETSISSVRRRNVCEQLREGEGEISDAGVQEVEGGCGLYAERAAPSEAYGEVPG